MGTIRTENRSVEELLGEVANEFFQQLEQGNHPDVEEYAQRYPELAEQIRLTFPALELVGDAISSGGNATLGPAASGHLSQQRLGDFQIVRELGRGGMGVVYEAQQISMGRQVALKVLPFAALADEIPLRRFKNEVRAVATLEHPNIVSVYSVGEERGVHYYAMQLIRGRSLAETIEQLARLKNDPQPLDGDSISRVLESFDASEEPAASGDAPTEDLRTSAEGETESRDDAATTDPEMQAAVSTLSGTAPAREYYRRAAELGIQAATALAHAHENGILHRDIKPANLLLDATGSIYLTDFGLARIEADAGVTMTGQVVGTLRYMSPEQALAKRVAIDHRSDIYSLGMTLYELLALRPAFDAKSRQEILAQIAFEEPPKLRRLARSIPSELETIVAKAIEKSPEDRYASAAELADDLQAFLDDRPIAARPPTLVHRLGKWSRRNRGLVASGAVAGGICLVLLVISNILIAGQKALAEKAADGERIQRENAEIERDAAKQARDQAEDVTKFLLDAFRSPDPERDGHTITVVEVLDRAVEKLDSRATMDPQRKASLLDAIADTYRGLGLGRKAVPLLEQVRMGHHEELGERHPETLEAMHDLATAYQLAGRHPEALDLLEQAVQIRRDELGERHAKTLVLMHDLGNAYHYAGDYLKSVKLFEQTLDLRREVLGERHRGTIVTMSCLASSYLFAGRYQEAIDLQEQALALNREIFGPRHRHTLSNMGGLASAYKSAGRHAAAINVHRQTLKLKREVLGEQHPDTLTTMSNLAMAYEAAGRHSEAIKLHDQTYQLRREALGERHPQTLHSMTCLANAYRSVGRYQDAVDLHAQTLNLQREVLGERHPDTLRTMASLASDYGDAGRYQDAVELQQQTLELMRAELDERHPSTLGSMNSLAVDYVHLGRYLEAIERFEQLLKLQREELGDRHPATLTTMGNLAATYQYAGRYPEAMELEEKTLKLKREELGDRHPSTLTAMGNLARASRRAGHYSKAIELIEQTLELHREVLGDQHPDTLSTMAELAIVYRLVRRHPEAIELNEQTLKVRREVLGQRHPETFHSMCNLADTYCEGGRHAEAIELYEQTLKLTREDLGERHTITVGTMNSLANAYGFIGRFAEAVELQKRTLELTRAVQGEQHPNTLTSMNCLAEAYRSLGQHEEAIELHNQTLKLRREVLGPWHPHTLLSITGRADAYRAAGRYAEADKLYEEAIAFLQSPPAESAKDPDTIDREYTKVLGGAAESKLQLKQPEKAESLARESLKLRERLIPEHWARFSAQSLLGAALLQQGKVDEAEQHLLDGFAGMQARKDTMPASARRRLLETRQSLVDLYQSKGNAEQAEQWKQTLASLP